MIFFALFMLMQGQVFAQLIPITLPKSHGIMYVMGGYNRDWFAKSDLSIKGPGYDLTFQKLTADDGWKLFDPKEWQSHTPQFSFRIGYQFKGEDNIGIELSYDYMNYTVRNHQMAHVNGTVAEETIDSDTMLYQNDFLFKQSNGAGLLGLSFVKAFDLLWSPHETHLLQAVIKPGGGVAVSRSTVKLFNDEHQSNYDINSYMVCGEVTLRYIFYQHLILDAGVKGAYVNYMRIPALEYGEAKQVVMPFMAVASIGYRFSL
jgi:hypothetical protein